MERALRNADKAGDTEAARRIAAAIRDAKSGSSTAPKTDRLPEERGMGERVGEAGLTWMESSIAGIPVIGPALQTGSDYLGTEIMGRLSGQDPAQMREDIWARRGQRAENNPASAMSGNLAGAMGPIGAAGATATGARLLGITGKNLGTRAAASGLSSAAISGADTAARGGDTADVLTSTGIGGTIGAAIPIVGAGISKGIGAVANKVGSGTRGVFRPEAEASRRVGAALQRDMASSPQAIANQADEAVAREAGIPMLNVDRGGETTRALARSVGNQSPEARATIERVASDRFAAQGDRATGFIRKIAGGNVDDLAFQDGIRIAAQSTNRPAYNRAYANPRAQSMWDQDFEQLMQAPAIQQSAKEATERGANRAAAEGFQPVKNPFQEVDGRLTLKRNPDGSTARPTLQFWDQVKRNLDSKIGVAERGGDNTLAGDLRTLKRALVDKLDQTVPEYGVARKGAAAFFDAEDAVEAGRKFVNARRSIPEAKRAFEKFSPAEKAGFRAGFASEMIDKIGAVGDRTNVINQVFKSKAAREQIELVFGPEKAKELEAYVRVEDLVDRLRGAMGNSTTARQLVELGIGAGGGYYATGDITGAAAGALAAKGFRSARQAVDNRVMQKVAEMLVSDDPKMIEAAVKQATKSQGFMNALESLGTMLAAPSRGAAISAQQPGPLELTVTQPAGVQ